MMAAVADVRALLVRRPAGPAAPSSIRFSAVRSPFYLFTLPAWQLLTGWLTDARRPRRGRRRDSSSPSAAGRGCGARIGTVARATGRRASGIAARGLSMAFALRPADVCRRGSTWAGSSGSSPDHTVFAGVTYTDSAHVTLTGLLVVRGRAGRRRAHRRSSTPSRRPELGWLGAAVVPAVVCYLLVARRRLVRQQLRRQAERARARAPVHRAQHRDDAAGVRARPHRAAAVPGRDRHRSRRTRANNQETLQNIRLWDWRALQDTLRQIQEIRTYYDFPDIDIDRYEINGTVRQMMLAVRELNVDRLPESSRNWINEKLIYTHGYGVTMNPVNGFTPEGLPALILSNMPVAEHASRASR